YKPNKDDSAFWGTFDTAKERHGVVEYDEVRDEFSKARKYIK
ncbi:MAG: hypothetical protein K0R90_359, partial [Oscillospiraceae bacterium]|nr:hypothetical protein [Oscillospiraceae bacterium]